MTLLRLLRATPALATLLRLLLRVASNGTYVTTCGRPPLMIQGHASQGLNAHSDHVASARRGWGYTRSPRPLFAASRRGGVLRLFLCPWLPPCFCSLCTFVGAEVNSSVHEHLEDGGGVEMLHFPHDPRTFARLQLQLIADLLLLLFQSSALGPKLLDLVLCEIGASEENVLRAVSCHASCQKPRLAGAPRCLALRP